MRRAVPEGDDRQRDVCGACGQVHYDNPRLVAACLAEHQGHLLVCRRAIEPCHGLWTVPGGFLELGEGTEAGAIREAREEARATVRPSRPFGWFDLPHIGQVHVFFLGELVDGVHAPGHETSETRLVTLAEARALPLAFPVLAIALELLDGDRTAGRQQLHLAELHWNGAGDRFDPAQYALRGHRALEL